MEAVGLSRRLSHYPAQLSGGEQQRVALARALAPDPLILAADEPTGNLDSETGASVIDLIFAQQQRRGATLVLVTHDPGLAARCGRRVRLRSGRIESDGGLMSASRFRALPFGLRFALRDLLGDPRGFGIFIACIVIGVAAISGVSGLARSLSEGLAREGRTILGGDASFSMVARDFTPEQRAFFEARGRLSEISLMRAMARRDDGEAALVEIKAVDPATYPAFGAVALDPAQPLAEALGEKDGAFGIVVDPILLARLDMKLGDRLMIGNARVEPRAKLDSEPDKLAGGVGFGPRVMMTRAALAATGLMTPGSVVRHVTRVTLNGNVSDDEVKSFAKAAEATFPQAGWEARTRDAVSPQFSRNLERFTQMLTLVALTALVAGGAGVANAVQGFVERKRMQFAVLKALGATGSRVFVIALAQVMIAAAFAIILGLAVGALIPWAAAEALRSVAELPVSAALDARGMIFGALYGLLVTLIFSLVPLGRAHQIPVAALLRDDPRNIRLTRYRLGAALAAIALAGLVMLSSADMKLGAYYVVAAGAAFALLRGAAWLTMRVARALPRPQRRTAAAGARQHLAAQKPDPGAGRLHRSDADPADHARARRRRHSQRTRARRRRRDPELLLRRRPEGADGGLQ